MFLECMCHQNKFYHRTHRFGKVDPRSPKVAISTTPVWERRIKTRREGKRLLHIVKIPNIFLTFVVDNKLSQMSAVSI
jgi:hypothetical protein